LANLINLNAEEGANMIGDDVNPTLTLTNSSTGAGIQIDRLVVTSTATIGGDVNFAGTTAGLTTITAPVTLISTTTLVTSLNIIRTQIGNGSVALAVFSVSGASVPVFEFQRNAIVSAVSIVFAASGNWAGTGVVRVKHADNTTLGWIPVLPSAVVTAAAI
jgi:hypothetical protein